MLQGTTVYSGGSMGAVHALHPLSAATPGSGAQNDLCPLLPPLLQPTQVRTPGRGGADLPKHTYVMPDFDLKIFYR